MKNIINTVFEYVHKNELISSGDQILIALSGGPDSTALLHILYKLSKKIGFGITAFYIDHNIRPKAVKKEILFCQTFCRKFKIPFISAELDIPLIAQKKKMSLEEAGHFKRKELLPKTADGQGCNKIALGHHLDDLIETILFRLFRGTGPGGLQPLKPQSGRFIRPLMDLSKLEIYAYLKYNKLSYMTDRSNLKSEYSRNYIRNKIIPKIEKHFGLKYRQSIANFSRLISDENDFLDSLSEKEFKKIVKKTDGGKFIVDSVKIALYDVWLRRRIIKKILERLTGHVGSGSFSEVEQVEKVIKGDLKAAQLGGKVRARAEKGSIYFSKGDFKIAQRKFNHNGKTDIAELNIKMNCREIEKKRAQKSIMKNGYRINIDHNKIIDPLIVRGLKPGDRFAPLGMRGTKKIGDFLTDRKNPAVLRDEVLIVADKKGIVWLVGHQIADRVKIDKFTKKVLEIEVIRNWKKGN